MTLTEDQKKGLGLAFCEATLLGVELDAEHRRVGATLSVLSLPPDGGPMPDDRRIQIIFKPVGRVVVHLNESGRESSSPRVVQLKPEEILSAVQSFGGCPTYAHECIDVADDPRTAACWKSPSLDWSSGTDGTRHFVEWFQDGPNRFLVIRVWFDAMTIRTGPGVEISIDEVVAAGRRWWDAFYKEDPRTQGLGMFPMKGKAGKTDDVR